MRPDRASERAHPSQNVLMADVMGGGESTDLWNRRPRACATDLPREVFPTPGGPTRQRMGPLRLRLSERTAMYSTMRFLTYMNHHDTRLVSYMCFRVCGGGKTLSIRHRAPYLVEPVVVAVQLRLHTTHVQPTGLVLMGRQGVRVRGMMMMMLMLMRLLLS
jgi:hypothetical protein